MRRHLIPPMVVCALLLTSCGTQPAGSTCTRTYNVGLVTDGKLADGSFNANAWQGIRDAVADESLCVQARAIESAQSTDYQKNIQQLVDQNYDLVVTVGILLANDTRTAAEKNPSVKFAIVDFGPYDKPSPNLLALVFKEDQAGYLVGALAGLMTKTNVVAGVYGLDVPAIARYRKGFDNGARSTNAQVRVLGVYQPAGGPNLFNDLDWGKARAEDFFRQGADIVFGAGGNTVNGALLAAVQQDKICIGVDVDQYISYPDVRKCLMTSAVKRFAVAVKTAIEAMVKNQWPSSGVLTFDAKNSGIGIAPYHDFESRIPADVKTKIEGIKRKLTEGSLSSGVE